jgi:hypothetical protein
MTPAWNTRLDALQISSLADIFRTLNRLLGWFDCLAHSLALLAIPATGMQTIIDHAKADAEAFDCWWL